MFLIILYIAGGVYFLLMATGLLHREYMSAMGRNRRLGLIVMGAGFVILGISQIFYYTLRSESSPVKSRQIKEHFRQYQAPDQ